MFGTSHRRLPLGDTFWSALQYVKLRILYMVYLSFVYKNITWEERLNALVARMEAVENA